MAVPSWVTMTGVSSSTVAAVGYDVEPRKLYVRWNDGRAGVYVGVPSHVYLDFLRAPSKGKFLYHTVRNGGRDNLYDFHYV